MYNLIKANPKLNSKNNEEDDEESQTSYTISQNQVSWSRFIVRMHNPIGNASEYATLFNLLDSASEDDEIKIDISSPGGSFDTCILIQRAIKDCSGQVTCRIGPTCASAAGAIALACDGWELDDMSTMLVHTGSFAPGFGKVHDIHAASAHTLEQIKRFVRNTYADFLTEDELNAVLDGKEMYIGPEELGDRLDRFAQAREASMIEQHRMTPSEEYLEDDEDFGFPSQFPELDKSE